MNRNITIRQLRAFVTVVQERSFTRAATRLGVTQSALTIAIRNLEAEIELKLLDRTTRSIVPTAPGQVFVSVAARLIEDMEHALDELRAQVERRSGLVVIASAGSLIREVIAPALGTLATRYPGISVRLHEELMDGAMRRLMGGELDFAIVTVPRPQQDLDVLPLVRDRFGLVCHGKHALAQGKRALAWDALRGHPVVGLSIGNGVRHVLERHAECAPSLEAMRYEVSSLSALLRLVEQGLGVATVPVLSAASMQPAIRFRPLTPAVHRTVFLAKRRGRAPSPAASEVAVLMLEHLARLKRPGIEVLADTSSLAKLGFRAR
jgi:DNA-binding transcriptional LysR family regulator